MTENINDYGVSMRQQQQHQKEQKQQQRQEQHQQGPPIQDIVLPVSTPTGSSQTIPVLASDTNFSHRAVHKIRLEALAHNYSEVESAANRQRCSVIVVVKADGYGHGAIPTAIFLADVIGADAFAVATLEEGIALRKALQTSANAGSTGSLALLNRLGNYAYNYSNQSTGVSSGIGGGGTPGSAGLSSHRNSWSEQQLQDILSSVGGIGNDNFSITYGPPTKGRGRKRSFRSGHVRILVLGPPVGFPRCFDDYYHHDIEVMITGEEASRALMHWVLNKNERMRKRVERAAAEAKERILSDHHHHLQLDNGNTAAASRQRPKNLESRDSIISAGEGSVDNQSLGSSTRSVQSSSSGALPMPATLQQIQSQYHPPSATLSNVTGSDLAKEVREILRNQKIVEQQQQQQQHGQQDIHATSRKSIHTSASSSTVSSGQDPARMHATATTTTTFTVPSTASSINNNIKTSNLATGTTTVAPVQVFAGIEDAARVSRTRQKVIANNVFYEDEDESDYDRQFVGAHIDELKNDGQKKPEQSPHVLCHPNGTVGITSQGLGTNSLTRSDSMSIGSTPRKHNLNGVKTRIPTNSNPNALALASPPKKRLRWHALVDSGMGRLGFRTGVVAKEDHGKRRDSVEIIKELVDLEVTPDCPIEFFGMCTHMADANSTSTYTNSQMNKFKALLKRVRAAGISVPTISTDNSAALLTANLTHFDPKDLLTQSNADSRGFVRTGGAIYGQRPAFVQLRAVSTLMASVRHVAILKEGESVGYDRAYVAPRNVRIATLGVGFADGYCRELGNGVGTVSIRGHLFPVVGNICMDMLMVELGPAGDKYGAGAQVVVGDTAILWGPDDGEDGDGHVPLKDLAAALKTTQSALTCGLNKERILRVYS